VCFFFFQAEGGKGGRGGGGGFSVWLFRLLTNFFISPPLFLFIRENLWKVEQSRPQGFSGGKEKNPHPLGMITAAHAEKGGAQTRFAFGAGGGGGNV